MRRSFVGQLAAVTMGASPVVESTAAFVLRVESSPKPATAPAQTSPPPAAFDQGRVEPVPTTNEPSDAVDAPEAHHGAPYRSREEVRRRIGAWHSMRALGVRLGAR